MGAAGVSEFWPAAYPGGMAASFELRGVARGDYPEDWPFVAWAIKCMAGWKCERCGVPHGPIPDVLTVHHLDGVKDNLESWNLCALCQRCHLRIQHRVVFYQDWWLPHAPWMARHVLDHNEWAARNGRPQLPLVGVEPERSYAGEWA